MCSRLSRICAASPSCSPAVFFGLRVWFGWQACKQARQLTEKLMTPSSKEDGAAASSKSPAQHSFPSGHFCGALHDAFFRISYDDIFPSMFVRCCCSPAWRLLCVSCTSPFAGARCWFRRVCGVCGEWWFSRVHPCVRACSSVSALARVVLVGTYSKSQLPPVATSAEALDFLKKPRPCCEAHLNKGCHDEDISRCVCSKVGSLVRPSGRCVNYAHA